MAPLAADAPACCDNLGSGVAVLLLHAICLAAPAGWLVPVSDHYHPRAQAYNGDGDDEAADIRAAADAAEAAAGPVSTSARGPAEQEEEGRDEEQEVKWSAFDDMVESWLGGSKPRGSEVASYAEQEAGAAAGSTVLCARCYSLRHYG